MSLGIAFKGPEGIALAADSRVTLTTQLPDGTILPSYYDNAIKLLKIDGQPYMGVVTYGVGAIGEREPRTAHSYVPEFEKTLGDERLTVEVFAQKLSEFFSERWKESMPDNFPPEQNMVFLIAGYDPGEAYGRVFDVFIPHRPNPVEQIPGGFGMIWGGQRELVDRLLQGFDDRLPGMVQSAGGLSDDDRNALRDQLRNELSLPIPYPFLPLQDCVDLVTFMVEATTKFQNWMIAIRGVGGAVDVATITRTDGFAPVQMKSTRR